MLDSVYLILSCCDHEVGPCRQQVLRALVVQKAVEAGKPEGRTPAALRLAENLEAIGEGFVGTVALWGRGRSGEVVES